MPVHSIARGGPFRFRPIAYLLRQLGAIPNGPPYLIARWASGKFADEPVRLFAGFGIAALAFATTYVAIGLGLSHATPLGWHAITVYWLALPPTGLSALSYLRNILVYRDKSWCARSCSITPI
jgi:hypothetical protein